MKEEVEEEGEHQGFRDKIKSVFRRRSPSPELKVGSTLATSVVTELAPGKAPSVMSASAPGETIVAPPVDFDGVIPTAGPGEEVVWVKTVTTTEIYDSASDPLLGDGGPMFIVETKKEVDLDRAVTAVPTEAVAPVDALAPTQVAQGNVVI